MTWMHPRCPDCGEMMRSKKKHRVSEPQKPGSMYARNFWCTACMKWIPKPKEEFRKWT